MQIWGHVATSYSFNRATANQLTGPPTSGGLETAGICFNRATANQLTGPSYIDYTLIGLLVFQSRHRESADRTVESKHRAATAVGYSCFNRATANQLTGPVARQQKCQI